MDPSFLLNAAQTILQITDLIERTKDAAMDAEMQAMVRKEAMDYLAEKYCLPPVEAKSTVEETTKDWTPWITKAIVLIREILDYEKERIFVVKPTGQAGAQQVTMVSDEIRVVCGDLACFFLIMNSTGINEVDSFQSSETWRSLFEMSRGRGELFALRLIQEELRELAATNLLDIG